ncbi:MAG: radical SAM protein [Candidatus Omnitrophota bacterium]
MRAYFKFLTGLCKAKILRSKMPLIAILCVTNKCNLKCWYCYGEHPYRGDCPDFTKEEWRDIITGLCSMGARIIQLQGGEPLLRRDLQEIICHIKKLGMLCDMVTNGVLIPDKIETIKLLDKICISLDGPREITDKNRGAGVFDKVTAAVKTVRQLKIPLRISAMLTNDSRREDIDWLINFAKEQKMFVNFSPFFEFTPRFSPPRPDGFNINDAHLRMLFAQIMKHKRNGAPIQFTQKSYDLARHWPLTYGRRRVFTDETFTKRVYPNCYHGDLIFFIDSDGGVYPCCNFWGKTEWNVKVHGLKEAIAGVSRRGCKYCYVPAYIDRNLFFNGSPSVWLNYVKQLLGSNVVTRNKR